MSYCRLDTLGGKVGGAAAATTVDSAHAQFRSLLRERLKEQPYPLFCFDEGVIPAASVWTGARLWVDAFRTAGLVSGDRLLITLPPSAAWLQVVVAAIWEGLTLALAPPTASESDLCTLIETVDARAVITTPQAETVGERHFSADWCSGPVRVPDRLRDPRFPLTPEARFLLRTSGTTGSGKWIALSDGNVLSVILSHLPHFQLIEGYSRVLSVFPWTHAAGLFIDLFPALLSGAEIHRDANGGRNVEVLLDTFADQGITHCSGVPLVFRRLAQTERGLAFLRSLEGGIVGAAPIDAALTDVLRTTRLRVGYGQTEASPGITLGEPGVFPAPYYVGRPLGCQVRINPKDSHTLSFQGTNACVGTWNPQTGYITLPPDRWQNTGDIVREDANGELFFVARTDASFKLSNGRFIAAGVYESAIREACPTATDDLLLFTREGESLELATAVPLDRDTVIKALGAVGKLLSHIHTVEQDAFKRTPKGILDRNATRAAL